MRNDGIETPTSERASRIRLNHRLACSPVITPRGMPAASAMSAAMMLSSRVAGARSARSWSTGWRKR